MLLASSTSGRTVLRPYAAVGCGHGRASAKRNAQVRFDASLPRSLKNSDGALVDRDEGIWMLPTHRACVEIKSRLGAKARRCSSWAVGVHQEGVRIFDNKGGGREPKSGDYRSDGSPERIGNGLITARPRWTGDMCAVWLLNPRVDGGTVQC